MPCGFLGEPGEAPLPLLIRVSHDDCFQCPVETFHEPVSRGVLGGRPRELNATLPGQGLEKLRFKLTSLVGVDCLLATEAGYPAGK
jgi:hypothetical protein